MPCVGPPAAKATGYATYRPSYDHFMQFLSFNALEQYWTGGFLAANAVIAVNLLGALLLGMLVGYERSYNGRAAGMRTYGLVCMAATALTIFVGYARYWYGGITSSGFPVPPDPTRVVQGIVTGIGFLGGGVIMKDGLNIKGLTTAASIWAASAIGVLLGVGFYGAALFMALLATASMSLLQRLESWLPTRMVLGVTLTFRENFTPKEDVLARAASERGYLLLRDSLAISFENGRPVWRFNTVALDRNRVVSPAQLAEELTAFDGVVNFTLTPARS